MIFRNLLFLLIAIAGANLSTKAKAAADVPQLAFNSSYQADCDTGNEQSCIQLLLDFYTVAQNAYAAKEEISKSSFLAALDLQKGCQSGSPTACAINSAARLLFEQADTEGSEGNLILRAITPEQERDVAVINVACDQRSAVACILAAVISDVREETERKEVMIHRAIELASPACDNGDARICDVIALYYEEIKSALAFDYYWRGHNKECESINACFEAGVKYGTYPETKILKRNIYLSYLFFTKACDGGEPRACTNLSLIYGGGVYARGDFFGGQLVIPADIARSNELAQKACDGGDGLGCFNIGLISVLATPEMKIDANSLAMFKKACADPLYRRACYAVGQGYLLGVGVPRNPTLAKEFFIQSCAESDQECRDYVERTGQAKPIEITKIIGQFWH